MKENKTKLKVKKDVKVKEPKAKKPKIDKSNPNWKLKPNLSINVYEKVNEYIIIYLSDLIMDVYYSVPLLLLYHLPKVSVYRGVSRIIFIRG